MGNINDHLTGRTVTTTGATRTRRFSKDFPGWGAPDHAEHLLPIPAGLTGVITAVESHGSNPWTRYSVRFTDGSYAAGLALGAEITLVVK